MSSVRLHRRAFVGLGSNLGDRWTRLRGAVSERDGVVGLGPLDP